MQTETFKTGERVRASLGYGNLTLGIYVKPDDQKKGNHFLQLDGIMCLQSISNKKFTAYAENCETITKDNLKTGMYARTIRGDVFTVLLGTKDGDLLVNLENAKSLTRYTFFLEDESDPQNTIQSIFQPNNMFNYLNTRKDSTAVWHREPERESMTLSQIEQELGKRIRLIEE